MLPNKIQVFFALRIQYMFCVLRPHLCLQVCSQIVATCLPMGSQDGFTCHPWCGSKGTNRKQTWTKGKQVLPGCSPVERLFFRRSLPARSTMNSRPTLAFCSGAPSGSPRWTTVSMTMTWLRLDIAFRAVQATALQPIHPRFAALLLPLNRA